MSATGTRGNDNSKQAINRRQGPREGSVVWAMIEVLDGKRTPMKPAEILAEIQKRGLAKKLAGKTPEASVAARLAVHVGVYFERPEKGKYQLKKGVTAQSIASGNSSDSAAITSTGRKSTGATDRKKPAARGRKKSPRTPAAKQKQPPARNTADETTVTA